MQLNQQKDLGQYVHIERSEIIDRLKAMQTQESKTYRKSDYLKNLPVNADTVDAWCRNKMVEWCYQVIDFVKFRRETVSIAMSYLDRFLGAKSPRSQQVIKCRKEYQLAAMTCLYIAIKLFEPKLIDTRVLSELSRGCYCPEDFKIMESDILRDLQWFMNDPTPLTYLNHCVALLPIHDCGTEIKTEIIFEVAKEQIELSVADYSLITQSCSNIAIAALRNSVQKALHCHQGSEIIEENLLKPIEKIFPDSQSENILKVAEQLETIHSKTSSLCRGKIRILQETPPYKMKKRQKSTGKSSPTCVST